MIQKNDKLNFYEYFRYFTPLLHKSARNVKVLSSLIYIVFLETFSPYLKPKKVNKTNNPNDRERKSKLGMKRR